MAGGRFEVALAEPTSRRRAASRTSSSWSPAHPAAAAPAREGRLGRRALAHRLAIAVVAASGVAGAATLIFDEVDAGIGGAVAETVGRRCSSSARERQVLCVTHLPQVAASGHDQWPPSRNRRRWQSEQLEHVALDRGAASTSWRACSEGPRNTGAKHAAELLDAE